MGQPILTPLEMRDAESQLFASGTDSFAVMSRAGQAVAEFVHANWPDGVIQILCGPGGNGGDGFIAASRLAKLWRKVEVFCVVEVSALTGDTAKAAAEWSGPVKPLDEALSAPHDLVLDALYGAGLSRPLEGPALALALRGGRVISIDVPTGLDCLTAQPLWPCFVAKGTITFQALRPAHVLMPGAALCGVVTVADIGVPVETKCVSNSPLLWARALPQPGQSTYKHQRGHFKVVSGGAWQTGAARLAARAGLRIGAGLVTLLSPPSALAVNAAHLTAIMLAPVDDPQDYREAAASATVVLIGPAAGVVPETRARVEALLKSEARIVLDADALTIYADRADQLFKRLRPSDLLTPHIGEFERLFGPLLSASVNKIEATREAAKRAGCHVLLKGPDTVIANSEGMALVNTHATRWLATAGSGDVLAGFIGGLMAQGVDTLTAAAMGAWLHGEAGRRIGAGLIAEDIETEIPDILSALHGEIPWTQE